jgi:hypothetical protein
MDTLQTIAPGGDHEDPFVDAGQKGSSYVSLALAITQRRVDSQIRRLGLQPRTDRQRDAARPKWAIMLAADEGRGRSTVEVLDAWIAATPHRDADRGARTAADRAEHRLSDLHPTAMVRYNDRRRSLDPMDAMWVAASQFSPETTATPSKGNPVTSEPTTTISYEVMVREVLDSRLADRVLGDSGWSELADALAQADRRSGRGAPEDLLRLAAGQRQLESARFPAKVLLHRIASAQETYPARVQPAGSAALKQHGTAPTGAGTASYPTTLTTLRSTTVQATIGDQYPDSPMTAGALRASRR